MITDYSTSSISKYIDDDISYIISINRSFVIKREIEILCFYSPGGWNTQIKFNYEILFLYYICNS